MMFLDQIKTSLRNGSSREIRRQVLEALDEGVSHEVILSAMLEEMAIIGKRFKANEIFVPEVLIIGRAFNVALDVINPLVSGQDMKAGKVVIGTVQGDLHDVGKNLVKMLMGSAGVQVIDLGVDVSAKAFVEAVKKYQPDMLAMSALLTTTMMQIKETMKALEKEGVREGLKVMVGGAPVTESFAEKIGADYFAPDAGSAAEIVRAYFIDKDRGKD